MSEDVRRYKKSVKESSDRIIAEGFPLARLGDAIRPSLKRYHLNHFLSEPYTSPEEVYSFEKDLCSKSYRKEHPSEVFKVIPDLFRERGDLVKSQGADVIAQYAYGLYDVSVKSVGKGEMLHQILWRNQIEKCDDKKGDVKICDGLAPGYWEDKGKGGHLPTVKGEGGKFRIQDNVFEKEYGPSWRDTEGPSLHSNSRKCKYLPHVLENDMDKLEGVLGELYITPEHACHQRGERFLTEEDVQMIVGFFTQNPYSESDKKNVQARVLAERENFICLVLLQRSSEMYDISGYRLSVPANAKAEHDNRIRGVFIRPHLFSVKNQVNRLATMSSCAHDMRKSGVTFRLVATAKRSNYAYNDNCVKLDEAALNRHFKETGE